MSAIAPVVASSTGFCALCQTAIAAGEETTVCSGCATVYHVDCWREIGGCGMYGCAQVPATEKREELEIPAAFWGRDTKPCPACGKEIQALAVRCRFCQADMRQVAPQTSSDWREDQRRMTEQPRLHRRIIWLAVLCALPLTAPLAAPIGMAWWWRRRRDIATLTGLYQTLVVVALAVASIQIVVVLLTVGLSALFTT